MVPALPFDIAAAQSGKVLVAGRLLVVGVAIQETTGVGVATLLLTDGGAAGGPGALPFNLAPSESVRDWFWPGIVYERGLFVTIGGAGTLTGSVLVIPESLLDSNHWSKRVWGLLEGTEHVV